MSLTKEVLDVVRQLNALKSTGPKTPEGRQRSKMNALKHNLSGQHLILQETEVEAYNRMSIGMLKYLKPKSEPERQIAQKIIDIHFRLNRMAAIENNMFSFGTVDNEHRDSDNERTAGHSGGRCARSDNEDRIEVMGAQSRAYARQAPVFDLLGRYEARLSRQLFKYQEEFERLQKERSRQERIDEDKSDEEIEADKFDPASFGHADPGRIDNPPAWRRLSYLPPPKDWKKPLADDPIAPETTKTEVRPLEKQAA